MKYIVCYDGGGTKTHIAFFDLKGNCYYSFIGKSSNHQSFDGKDFNIVLKDLYIDGLKELNIDSNSILFVYLGLSGADMPSDFDKLNKASKEIFNQTPFIVENDAWPIMRASLTEPFGAVCISGTGTNAAAINKDGKKVILRSLGYILGIHGGGIDIARDALHYAFRSNELTYHKTSLEDKIPKLFGLERIEEVIDLLYPKNTLTKSDYAKLTELTFNEAINNDKVSKEILVNIGKTLGHQTLGVMKQANIPNMKVPVVVGGKVLMNKYPLLKEAMLTEIKKVYPSSYLVESIYPPVVGSYLRALDILNIKQDNMINQNIKKDWEKI